MLSRKSPSLVGGCRVACASARRGAQPQGAPVWDLSPLEAAQVSLPVQPSAVALPRDPRTAQSVCPAPGVSCAWLTSGIRIS